MNFRLFRSFSLASLALLGASVSAHAQDRPFVFGIATSTEAEPRRARVDYEFGLGERAFQSSVANQPEQRIGLQASFGRVTLLGRVGLADTGSAYQSSQAGELLVSLITPSPGFTLAAGGGVQHEAGGANVLLARVSAGREAVAWRALANLMLQKPLTKGRDAVDLLTTIGIARKLGAALSLGLEAVGEDLEGFWDPLEAEGGARLLIGPSMHIASASRKWQLAVAGGPMFHPSNNGRSSDALRDLPPTTRRLGYAFRTGLSVNVF